MLTENGKHTLNGSQHGTVNHNGTCKLFPLLFRPRIVLQVKSDRKLEVELDCGALMDAFHGIHNLDINLGPVEGSVARVDSPVPFADELIHGIGQGLLSAVPQFHVTQSFRRASGQLKLVRHTERIIDGFHEIQCTQYLLFDLIFAAVNMSIVLLETPNTSQPSQSAGKFVPVQDTEVSQSKRQVTVGPNRVTEHKTMARTVHWLHGPFCPFDIEAKHGVLVVHRVTGLMPQIQVVNVRSDDFVISSLPVMVTNERDEFVVDAGTVGKPEGTTRRQVVKHDQFLLLGNATMIAFFCLFLVLLPHFQLLLVGETNTIHALQGFIVGVPKPLRGRMSGGCKGLDLPSVRHMWPSTQINQIPTFVHGRARAVGYLGGQNFNLEWVIGE
mmetsp:Transcript_52532/g.78488  ORF Transcript_52532/g.78488 Transcript_52532/m.78488 type:complete len:385 (-) Transcript_52532:986-2140(-)